MARTIAAAVAFAALSLSCATVQRDEVAALMARFPLGATQDGLAAALERHCTDLAVHHYSAEQAAPYRQQVQIDCMGYQFRGAPRKLELLINEGELGFYWLLLDASELEATRTLLMDRFGAPTCLTARDTIFGAAGVALRREPAEILVAADEDFRAITGGCPN